MKPKQEYINAKVYIRALDRNIEVIEENYILLKNLKPEIFEEDDTNKPKRGKYNSINVDRESNAND